MIKAFVSYSSNDSLFADRLVQDLMSFEENIFYAKYSIKVGDSIIEKISEALSSHDKLLVILSKSSVKSNWVKKEINSSLMRQLSNKNIKIVPILFEECEIPVLLTDIKYADFTDSYSSGFNEIINSFENEIELGMYLEIVKKACPEIQLEEEQVKELAILLKKIDPIPFFRNEIFSHIVESESISENELLSKIFNPEYSSFEVIPKAKEHIAYLSKEGLIAINDAEKQISIKTLGISIFKCLDYGFNEGLF